MNLVQKLMWWKKKKSISEEVEYVDENEESWEEPEVLDRKQLDIRKEEDRVKFENDNESPFWYSDGRAPTIPCCSVTDFAPTNVQIEKFNAAIEEDRRNQK